MKNIIPKTIAVALALLMYHPITANPLNDTVTMGPGYANDIYYSLENGTIKVEPRNNWDIAFYTLRWSAGISINDGMGVVLYTYPLDDTSSWHSIDVSTMESWAPMYNSDTIWENGAFNRNAPGHPDYGWGIYNMVSHDVVGDSIYILQLANGSLKKLWIQNKISVSNTYHFKYANIDGTEEVSETLNADPYLDKMFIYYSITNQEMVDREPAMSTWDLVFSRYIGTVFDNEGNPSPYPVVGVLNNLETGANKFEDVDVQFEDYLSAPMLFERSPIGSDWKAFNMDSFAWEIQENHAFFIQTQAGDIYKLVFDYFGGTGTGRIGFTKKLVSLASIPESDQADQLFQAYPNPAKQMLNLRFETAHNTRAYVQLFDMSGRKVIGQGIDMNTTIHQIDLGQFKNGIYLLNLLVDGVQYTQKLIIQN